MKNVVVIVEYVTAGGASTDLLLSLTKFLHVDGLHHFLAVGHARLLKSLTATQFFYDTGFLEFALELLESLLNVLAFFYLYDYHFSVFLLFVLFMIPNRCYRAQRGCKIMQTSRHGKIFQSKNEKNDDTLVIRSIFARSFPPLRGYSVVRQPLLRGIRTSVNT